HPRRREAQARMQARACFTEQVTAVEQIGAVVDVAPVGGAPSRRDETGTAQLAEVVRDEVLRLAGERDELTHAPVAAPELGHELPAERIGDEPEDLGRRGRRCHADDTTSNAIDAIGVRTSPAPPTR